MQLQHGRVKAYPFQMQACCRITCCKMLDIDRSLQLAEKRACGLAALSRAACQLQRACVGIDGSGSVARAHEGVPAVLEEQVAVRQAGAVGRCSLILTRMPSLFGCEGVTVRWSYKMKCTKAPRADQQSCIISRHGSKRHHAHARIVMTSTHSRRVQPSAGHAFLRQLVHTGRIAPAAGADTRRSRPRGPRARAGGASATP